MGDLGGQVLRQSRSHGPTDWQGSASGVGGFPSPAFGVARAHHEVDARALGGAGRAAALGVPLPPCACG